MAKFKTKPFEIEAIQYTGKNEDEIVEFTKGRFNELDPEDRGDDPECVAQVFDVLHSTWVGVKVGQWIIKGNKGEFYPCDPEIFEAKYEEVYDEEPAPVTRAGLSAAEEAPKTATPQRAGGVITSSQTIDRYPGRGIGGGRKRR